MKFTLLIMALVVSSFGQVNVVVSIIPQKTFVEKIGGDKVNVTALVLPGQSPHTYEPKPSQMMELSKAHIYFPIKIEFENAWLEKFASQNKKMQIVYMTKGIRFITMKKRKRNKQNETKHIVKPDPHTWISPMNVQLMAKNIFETLSSVDAENTAYYKENYIKFINEIQMVDAKIRETLLSVPNETKFMVFHPAWGYFARDYGLVQFPVEVEGKDLKPKELVKLIEKAKKEKIKAILVQKEFSDKSAKIIANELNIKVLRESPLASNWGENLIKMSQIVANNK